MCGDERRRRPRDLEGFGIPCQAKRASVELLKAHEDPHVEQRIPTKSLKLDEKCGRRGCKMIILSTPLVVEAAIRRFLGRKLKTTTGIQLG